MTAQSNEYKENLQARFSRTLAQLDTRLGQFKYCNEFERRTGIPKSYAALGVAGLVVLMIIFDLAGQLLTNFISWVYPAYASFKAIETPSPYDDKQWLTYWTVIGFVQIVEYFSDILLFWVPFYFLFKTLFVLWLALPQFRGAETLYTHFLRPYLLEAQTDIDRKAEHLREKVGEFASDLIGKKEQ